MRAPHETDSVVEHILEILRPLEPGMERTATALVVEGLGSVIEVVNAVERLPDGPALRQYAKKLDKTLAEVEKQLASPWFTLVMWSTRDDEIRARLKKRIAAFLSEETPVEQGRSPRIWEGWDVEPREAALAALAPIRAACARALSPAGYRLRHHPNYDYVKYWSAMVAFLLMGLLSTHKITGTEGGPFWNVASLVYEATTRKRSGSMKRACDRVLASRRLGTDSA
jgi:hypothetical protein